MWIIRPPLDNKGNFEKLSLFLLVEKSGEFTYLFFTVLKALKSGCGKVKVRGKLYISFLPSSALIRVNSSAYSRSAPTGTPYASLLTLTPSGFIILE